MQTSKDAAKEMVTKKTWEDFRKTGLLLFINSILHAFGWSIVVEIDKDKVVQVYPARVTFRGFDNRDTEDAHKSIGKYLKENADELFTEATAE